MTAHIYGDLHCQCGHPNCNGKPANRAPSRSLTRVEALGLIEGAEAEREPADRLHFLQDLQEHWIGHRDCIGGADPDDAADVTAAAEEVAQLLAEYVYECAVPQDDRTPRGTDPTGLTKPPGADWQ
jgi:hypothetical protein